MSTSLDQLDGPAPSPAGARDLGLAFWLAYQTYQLELGRGLGAAGFPDLRAADASLLRYLYEKDGTTVTELARLLDITKQAASQHVSSFVARGYGIRTPSPDDGREKLVRLSERGRAARRAAIDFARRVEAELAEELGPGDVAAMRRVIDHLITSRLDRASDLIRAAARLTSATEAVASSD